MSPCNWIETVEGGFAIYGLMWIMVFFLLFISHIVGHEQQTPPKNPEKDSPDDR